MSDKPRALSTIPPAQPVEPDYDSICSAVTATARGRWFLDEYARRNRNADTSQVLAAIERIAAVVAGDRVQQANQDVRIELLEMARAIAQTRAEVAESHPEAPPSHTAGQPGAAAQPDVAGAAERLRDIAWTMRACGVELGTSEQIEQIAETILSASSLRDPGDQRTQKLGEVLHYLEHRIDRMLDNHMEAAPIADAAPEAEPPPLAEIAAAVEPATIADAAPEVAVAPLADAAPEVGITSATAAADTTADIDTTTAPESSAPEVADAPAATFDVVELRVEHVELELEPLLVMPAGVADGSEENTPLEPQSETEWIASAVAPAGSQDAPSSTGDSALDAAFALPEAPAAATPEPDAGDRIETSFVMIELAPLVVAPVAADEAPTEPPAADTRSEVFQPVDLADLAPARPTTVDHALDQELAELPPAVAAQSTEPVVDVFFIDAESTETDSAGTDDDVAPTLSDVLLPAAVEPIDTVAGNAPPSGADREPNASEVTDHDFADVARGAPDVVAPPTQEPEVQSAVEAAPVAAAFEPQSAIAFEPEPAIAPVPQDIAAPAPEPDLVVAPVPEPEAVAAPADEHSGAQPVTAAEADSVALQVDQDLQSLFEFLPATGAPDAPEAPDVIALPADEPPAAAAVPPPEPPPESDVLSNAWETAILTPPVFPDKSANQRPLPSMWVQPVQGRRRREDEPADFLLEPLTPIAMPAVTAELGAVTQAEIEHELFAAPTGAVADSSPLPVAAAAIVPGVSAAAAAAAAAAVLEANAPATSPTVVAPASPARAPAKPMPRHGADNPLAALTAMTDEERIALFT